MKIWMLTTEFPPFYGGGIATYCVHTARMLVSQGHTVTVFTNDPAVQNGRTVTVNDGVRVVRFKPGASDAYRYLGYHAALSWDFSETVEEFIKTEGRPDVIESQDYLGIAFFLLQKKRTLWPNLADVPVILALHTPAFMSSAVAQAPVYRFPDFWVGEMERFSIRAADSLIFASRFLPDQLAKHLNLDGADTSLVRYPFRPDQLASDEENGGAAAKEDNIVFVGRLQYLKGVIQTLDHFGQLWDSGMTTTLTLTGTDTYFHPKNMMMSAYLQKKYGRYFSRDLVAWRGALPKAEFSTALRRARMVVMPSLFENFPYVVLECMALGKVVLTSDSGGQAEIVEDGKSGFVFSQGDAEGFKSKVLGIMQMTPEKVAEIGENAKRRVAEMCSYESVYPAKIEALRRASRPRQAARSFPFIRPRKKDETVEISAGYEDEDGLLSVVVPYYNLGAYVRDTLDSLASVTYPSREVIVANDGSDEPDSIATLYQIEKDYPVRILHKRNGGLATTRNAGARSARGEFLTFLDADDMVDADYYDWAVRILRAYDNVSFVGCWSEYFGAEKTIWPTWNPEPPYLLMHNTINTSSLVFRRRDFVRYGLNDPKIEYGIEDYESIVRMVKHGAMGVAIPKALFKWRVRPDSMSRGIGRESMLYLCSLISGKHAEFYREYATEVFNLLNSNGPGYLYDNPSREFPPVGFVAPGAAQAAASINVADATIPSELKATLTRLWRRPLFRKTVRAFFKLRMDKLF